MDFELSSEQQKIRETIIDFAKKELNNNVVERDRDQHFPHDLWLKCGEFGLQGLPVDVEYGGSGFDPITTAVALEALGYGSKDAGLNFAICAHLLACVVPLWRFGTDQQKKAYLPALCNGQLVAVNGATEHSGGSDVFSMKTTARKTDTNYVINGVKIFSSNGPVADIAMIYAMTDPDKGFFGGLSCFVLERESGFSSGQVFEKMGLRTCKIGELLVNDVAVDESQRIGKEGAGGIIFNYSMEWERICIAACHVGTMRRILEETISYAKERRQGSGHIGQNQAVSHKLADIKIRLEASRLLVYQAASKLDRSRSVGLDASMAKVFVSESLVKAAMDCVQTLGGNGYMVEYEMERTLRDSIASTIYSGTSEIQRNIIAKWLGL